MRLKKFSEENDGCGAVAVLIGRPWEKPEIHTKTITIKLYSTQEVSEALSVSNAESVNIFPRR